MQTPRYCVKWTGFLVSTEPRLYKQCGQSAIITSHHYYIGQLLPHCICANIDSASHYRSLLTTTPRAKAPATWPCPAKCLSVCCHAYQIFNWNSLKNRCVCLADTHMVPMVPTLERFHCIPQEDEGTTQGGIYTQCRSL